MLKVNITLLDFISDIIKFWWDDIIIWLEHLEERQNGEN